MLQDLAVVKERVEEGNRRVEDLASTVQELLFEGEPIAPERRDEISAAVAGPALGSAWASCIGRRGRFDRALLRQLLKEPESAGATEAANTFRGVPGEEGSAP